MLIWKGWGPKDGAEFRLAYFGLVYGTPLRKQAGDRSDGSHQRFHTTSHSPLSQPKE